MLNKYTDGNVFLYRNAQDSTIPGGSLVIAKSVCGVAIEDIEPGCEGALLLSGVYRFRLASPAGASYPQGTKVYADPETIFTDGSALTFNSTDTLPVGVLANNYNGVGLVVYVQIIPFITLGGGASVTIDSELSTTSTNPVQNMAIALAVNAKQDAPEAPGQPGDFLALDENGDPAFVPAPTITVDSELSSSSTNPAQNCVITIALGGKMDAPSAAGSAGQVLTVNSDGYGWADVPQPDLSQYYTSSQVDSALSGKADASHTHEQADVSGLTSALEGKLDAPESAGTVGQVLTVTSGGVAWETVPLPDMSDYYTSSQVDSALAEKMGYPESAGSAGQVLTATQGGYAWDDPPPPAQTSYTSSTSGTLTLSPDSADVTDWTPTTSSGVSGFTVSGTDCYDGTYADQGVANNHPEGVNLHWYKSDNGFCIIPSFDGPSWEYEQTKVWNWYFLERTTDLPADTSGESNLCEMSAPVPANTTTPDDAVTWTNGDGADGREAQGEYTGNQPAFSSASSVSHDGTIALGTGWTVGKEYYFRVNCNPQEGAITLGTGLSWDNNKGTTDAISPGLQNVLLVCVRTTGGVVSVCYARSVS